MNVQWRKLGNVIFAAGATLAICLAGTNTQAQTPDGSSPSGWHDRSATDDNADADARPIQPASDRPVRPSEVPRAGSLGYQPSYQQPQGSQNRSNATQSPADRGYRQSSNSTRNGQNAQYQNQYRNANGDQRRPVRPINQSQQYYSTSPAGSTAGPYYGYPPARARTASYSRQDIEYADDQPHMAPGPMMQGQPGMGVEMEPQDGPPMMAGPPGPYAVPGDGGCGCANGNCGAGGCPDGSCDGSCDCGCNCWPRNVCRAFTDWCHQDAFRDLSVYGGVQGFKGPIDDGMNGDFGFHEGMNWGVPLWGCAGIGAQFGAEIDHSDFAPNATPYDDHRTQYFITTGLFYRPTRECGWQGGLVWDYLDDEYYQAVTVSQLRGNLSYVVDWSEFGFEFNAAVHSDLHPAPINTIAALPSTLYSPVDLYTLYYGRRLRNGGQVKAFAGLADGLGAIVGADLDIAISDSFSLEGEFDYIIADKVAPGSVPGETANIAFSVVWHPGSHARDTFDSAYRPLFNVADNSTFIVNRTNR